MMVYLLFVACYIIGNGFYSIDISFIYFLLHFCNQFCIHFRKIIDKFNGFLYFMSNSSCKLSQGAIFPD